MCRGSRAFTTNSAESSLLSHYIFRQVKPRYIDLDVIRTTAGQASGAGYNILGAENIGSMLSPAS